jgi:hypothetical protein
MLSFADEIFLHFPDDENGDVLRRMADSDFPFEQPHDVDFYAVFPSHDDANLVARQLIGGHDAGERLAAVKTAPHHRAGTELKVVKTMLVTHENVTAFETRLADLCRTHGGKLDGWGVLQD